MINPPSYQRFVGIMPEYEAPPGDPCLMVVFGASGDMTRRLLMPALYNLQCDGLLPDHWAFLGVSMDPLDDASFKSRMTDSIQKFATRRAFNTDAWCAMEKCLYFEQGTFDDPALYARLGHRIRDLDRRHGCYSNVLFYLAVPPVLFGTIAQNLAAAGISKSEHGWRRLIVEKPFGRDLKSAQALNRELLACWSEDQIYRIDHYLGKETVQNLLTFRFSNGIFEPLWNRSHIDHIQFTVSEIVGMEGRGRYFESAGMLRDVMQNHMFQMLAYLCMEPPGSFKADEIRSEKAKVLNAVRILTPDEVSTHVVRGQYGAGRRPDGTAAVGYRHEPEVAPGSPIETFVAMRMFIDNWRWDGVPIYLRTGKSLWKRGTEIVVQFKRAPEVIFRGTPAASGLRANQLIFHIQPDQGIEQRFQAKTPGPLLALQPVNMRFDYQQSFDAARGTGYETLVYNCMLGDQTLFLRSDLVEIAWRIAQPILNAWERDMPEGFPDYPAGSWGPKAAFELIESDGRRWQDVVNRTMLERWPFLVGCDDVFLHNLAMVLRSDVFAAGDFIIRKGEQPTALYFLARGEVVVIDAEGRHVKELQAGELFGERSLLLGEPRSSSVRALTDCDVFILDKKDFVAALRGRPDFARSVAEIASQRYSLKILPGRLLGRKD